ncbi:MAG: TetR/AcrR family transcriptional regulator [Solirubrobacteraceae bacterium]
MPSVTRQRRGVAERRAAVERQVLEAVERLLAEGESFTSLGIQRIAEEAGMARTTFYGHFRDKPTLLMQVTDSATRELFGPSGDWVRNDESTQAELEETLLGLVRGYREHEPLLHAVTEVAAYEPEVAAYWRATIDEFAELLRKRLERDRKAGRVAQDLDTRTTASWIAWGTERTVAEHVASRPPREDARFAAGIAAAAWAALRRA